MVTKDETIHKKILNDSIHRLSQGLDAYRNAPEVGRLIHSLVKQHTGVVDPYHKLKSDELRLALAYYPEMKSFLSQKTDKLYWSLKIAAVGNVFDAAIHKQISDVSYIEQELIKEFKICDIGEFKRRLESAKTILVIGDNAAETVFDRVLIEELLDFNIVYAVRSGPIINDATVEEAA